MHWQKLLKRLTPKFPQLSEKQLSAIEKIANTNPENFRIPETVAVNENIEDLSLKEIILRFDTLLETECNWAELDPIKTVAIFRIFQRITSITVGELPHSGLVRGELDRHNQRFKSYNSLFVKVPPEDNLKEIELPGGGRIFFYMQGEKCYIVSIETQHRGLD